MTLTSMRILGNVFIDPGYQINLSWQQLDSALPLDWPHGWSPRDQYMDSGEGCAEAIKGWLSVLDGPRVRNLRISRRKVGEWEGLELNT